MLAVFEQIQCKTEPLRFQIEEKHKSKKSTDQRKAQIEEKHGSSSRAWRSADG
jgi:hypothetical protein